MLNFFRSTNWHKKYWQNRKIDWAKSYTATWNHPHRVLIRKVLSTFNWLSLIEIGCGSGANLIGIVKAFPDRQLGGIDVNPDAIKLVQETFKGGLFKVGSADDIMLSDSATDVIISDMCLIYVGPRKIDEYIEEVKRVARRYVIFCEFHSDSWWNRMALRFNSGYYAYNYDKLLKKHGYYDIIKYKLRESDWPDENGIGHEPQKTFAYLIKAKIIKL